MGLKIVTGRTGTPHVSSNQIQAFNRSLLGDLAILDLGQHFDAVVRDANTIRIYDGCIVMQGIYAVIPHDEYEDVLVGPVSVGNTRIDTIYLHYAKDMETDTETVELDIAQGEEAVNNPVKPDIDAGGDTWEGTTDIRIPLYDVTVTSFETTIVPYEYMNVYSPTISELQERIPETTVSGVKGDAESEYRSGNVNITPTNIGLGNVDNTADTDKPVSTAQQEALDDKVDKVTGKGLSTNDYTNAEKQKNADNASAIEDIQEDIAQSLSATGNPLTIESSESNLVECKAEVECVQEGSGDPSPENIRAITGQTEVVIEDAGKNLFNGQFESGYYDSSGKVYSVDWKRNTEYIDVIGGQNYVLSGELETLGNYSSNGIFFYTKDGSYLAYALFNIDALTFSKSVVTPQNCAKIGFYFRANANIKQTQFELGSTATKYEPYKGKTYTIQLGDTIYGGELDVTRGELVVDRGIDTVDDSWSYGTFGGKNYLAKDITHLLDILPICSMCDYGGVGGASIFVDGKFYSNGSTVFYINDNRYPSKQALLDVYGGSQICYELAEPYTIQLTPQQIRLLKGTNHLSCNTGDLTIKYYPDNVLGQLKGDIEDEIDAVANRIKGVKTMQISGAAVSTDGSIMFTNLIGSIIVGTSISNDANSNKCVGIPYSMGSVPALKIMNESTMAVLSNVHISGILYYIEL